jgi:flagellar hook-associated protein 2
MTRVFTYSVVLSWESERNEFSFNGISIHKGLQVPCRHHARNLHDQVGSGTAQNITINSSNDTLQGLADAINASNVGVSAAIINDGSSGQSYHLLLAAQNTGLAKAISITNNLAADNGNAVRQEFDSSYIGAVNTGANFSSTSAITANSGAGSYTGTSNNLYTFKMVNGGTVGTDSNITLSYSDQSGTNTGTITLAASDVGVAKSVAQGINVRDPQGRGHVYVD